MPTLIRFLILLIVLAGLVYGGMLALVIMVRPPDELVTIRIPPRELIPPADREPLTRREIDTGRTADSPPPVEPAAEPAEAPAQAEAAPAEAAPAEAAPSEAAPAEAAPAEAAPAEEGSEEGSIVTLAPGVE
jgi:hypothetical protein